MSKYLDMIIKNKYVPIDTHQGSPDVRTHTLFSNKLFHAQMNYLWKIVHFEKQFYKKKRVWVRHRNKLSKLPLSRIITGLTRVWGI